MKKYLPASPMDYYIENIQKSILNELLSDI